MILPQRNYPLYRTPEESPLLVEVAWEVCNQLGGIYTVLKTKAVSQQSRWGENYLLVGPYNPEAAAVEFESCPPTSPTIQRLLRLLAGRDIPAHFGRWLIPGTPQVILIDYRPRLKRSGDDKYLLWKDNGLSMDGADAEVDATIAFGFAVHELFAFLAELSPQRRIVGHFHEWMGAVALPRIAHLKTPVTTVFTTHATLLGRYEASSAPHFYDRLSQIDPEQSAIRFNIRPRYLLERGATHSATVFTTISAVTAREAEHLLGRKPDLILPNGINMQRFIALHEFQNLHQKYKEKINEFVMGHFFPHYTFNLDRTLYLFTSGRYEYRNKGTDLYIEALYQLNRRLKELPDPPTIVAFIVTKAWTKHVNVQVLQNQSRFEDLRTLCVEAEQGLSERLLSASAQGRLPGFDELLSPELQSRLKRAMYGFRSKGLPAIVTHDMVNDGEDAVLNHLRHRHLFNDPADPVKVVFHPEFINQNSIFGLDYEQFVRGCHLGVFPSAYEPWGYTPPECLALGIPAITTDLSGFGAFAQQYIRGHEEHGLSVINRSSRSANESIDQITENILRFSQASRRERIELRNRAERLTEHFDWGVLIHHYHEAHELALNRLS